MSFQHTASKSRHLGRISSTEGQTVTYFPEEEQKVFEFGLVLVSVVKVNRERFKKFVILSNLFCFPPHCSHQFQPLNVAFMKLLTHFKRRRKLVIRSVNLSLLQITFFLIHRIF